MAYTEEHVPYRFFVSAGVPETFVSYAKSLSVRVIQFRSCFVSYSNADVVFATTLYGDLLKAGVQTWYAPEDLNVGDYFRQKIDESIWLHDKLLLILSYSSVNSSWVQNEVETAMERESWEKRAVLFPIRIDNAVMTTGVAWASSIRRIRHIGNFSNWKDHDSYQEAFQRLLRDLKAERD